MSEFLVRMAARAMGVDPAATPRLPTRFETPAGAGTTSTGEPATPFPVVGPMATPPGARPAPPLAAHDPDTAPPPGLPGEPTAFQRPSAGRAGGPVAPITGPGQAVPLDRATDGAVEVAVTPAAARRLQPAPPSGASTPPAVPVLAGAGEHGLARVVVAAMPPPQALPARPANGSASTTERQHGPHGGPDTVHVTIGRVDVRTVIAPSIARPAPAAAPRTEPLLLVDYLRGRRDA